MTEPSSPARWHLPWGNVHLANLMLSEDQQPNGISSNPASSMANSQGSHNGLAQSGSSNLGEGMPMNTAPMAFFLQQPALLSLPQTNLLATSSSYNLAGIGQRTAPPLAKGPPSYDPPLAGGHNAPQPTAQHMRSSPGPQGGIVADAGYGLGLGSHSQIINRPGPSSPTNGKPLVYLAPHTLLPSGVQPAPMPGSRGSRQTASRYSGSTGLDRDPQDMWNTSLVASRFGDQLGMPSDALEARETVRKYLQITQHDQPHPGIIMFYAKIVQKSYGNEKRFFSPPPCVHLIGPRWNDAIQRDDMTLSIENTQTSVRFVFDASTSPMAGLARTLYIADSDKLRSFCLGLAVPGGAGTRSLGVFRSKPVRVISKPSQKRQTKANIDMCIESGSEVCLYSRLRAQASHTRYLQADQQNLFISSTLWSNLEITAANVHGQRLQAGLGQAVAPPPQLIEYGMDITLQNADYPLISPRVFTVYAVRGKTVLPVGCPKEPVVCFHKVCLFLKGSGDQYLAIVDDDVNTVRGQALPDGACLVPDSAVWTIITAERMDFPFYEARGPSLAAIAPCPTIISTTLKSGAELDLVGCDFTQNLTVWLDDVPASTTFRNTESMACVLPWNMAGPYTSVVYARMHRSGLSGHRRGTYYRLLLVRNTDFVVFATNYYILLAQ